MITSAEGAAGGGVTLTVMIREPLPSLGGVFREWPPYYS